MTPIRLKYLLFGLLLLLLILIGVAFSRPDLVLNHLVRPLAERVAGGFLHSEVEVGTLHFSDSALTLGDLAINGGGRYRLEIPRVEIDFTLGGLFRRKLKALRLFSPRGEIFPPPPSPEGVIVSGGSPSTPPLEIGSLVIEGGDIVYATLQRRYPLRHLTADISVGRKCRIEAETRFGEGEGLPLSILGEGTWEEGLVLTLTRLDWGGRELLRGNLTLGLGDERTVSGAVGLESLDNGDLETIAAAFSIGAPILSGWEVAIDGLEIDLRLGDEGWGIGLKAEDAGFWREGLSLPLEQVRLDLAQVNEAWRGEGTFQLPGGLSALVTAGFEKGELALEGTLSLPSPVDSPPATVKADVFRNAGGGARAELSAGTLAGSQLEGIANAIGWDFPLPEDWTVELHDTAVKWTTLEEGAKIRLEIAAGKVAAPEWSCPFDGVYADLSEKGEAWQGTGGFRLAASARGTVEAALEGGRVAGRLSWGVADAGSFVHGLLGDKAPSLAGGASLEADFRFADGTLKVDADLQGKSAPRPPRFLLDLSPLAARVELQGGEGGIEGKFRVRLEGGELLRGEWREKNLDFRLLPASWKSLAPLAGPGLLPAAIRDFEGLAGTGKVRFDSQSGFLVEGRFSADSLAMAEGKFLAPVLEGRLVPSSQGMTLEGAGFRAGWQGAGLTVPRLSGSGSGSLEGGVFSLRLHAVEAEGAEYLSADGMAGVTGGRLRGAGTIAADPEAGKLKLNAAADFGAGELLLGAFYAETSALAPWGSLKGEIDLASGKLLVDAMEILVPGIGEGQFRGLLAPAEIEIAASVKAHALEGEFSRYLSAALDASAPALKGMDLAGALSAEGTFRKNDRGWRARGELKPRGLEIGWPRILLKGVGCDGLIPFDFGRGMAGPESGQDRPGRLACDSLAVGPALLDAGRVSLLSGPDRYGVTEPLRLEVAGGRVTIEDLSVDLSREEPRLSATIGVSGVELGTLTEELGTTRMTGRIDADLGRIRYADGTLSSEGEATIQAFGGTLRIRNIRFQDPFSAYPNLLGDIDFSGIDLYRLTHTFSFGEMNGIADGFVHDLRLLGKTPSRFVARFETRPEGRRNISVKALKNLTILSQGGLSSILSQGVYRFIDFYRYRRIGLFCTLENDNFRLEGTARPDSDSYLVYGGILPPKIDIKAPPQTISFKEMVKRLSRIDRAGE